MFPAHALEYSKSSKAKCHGQLPCKGTYIDLGTLRHGVITNGPYGETVQWRHWGCVTPEILSQLAAVGLDRVQGFQKLKLADQKKVRQAIAIRRIDPADVPESAKAMPTPTQDLGRSASSNKRKAGSDPSGPSALVLQGSTSRTPIAGPSTTARSSAVIDAGDDEEDVDNVDESTDELYCMMKTNVVGVQYYNGMVGPMEEVRLVREPHNAYDRSAIQVLNIGGRQVGHLPRNVAAKLSPLLDQGLVGVEGVIMEGSLGGNQYTMSMTLKIYGPADQRRILEPLLKWATPGQRGFAPPKPNGVRGIPGAPKGYAASLAAGSSRFQDANGGYVAIAGAEDLERIQARMSATEVALRNAAELRQILKNLEKVDDESRRSSLLDTLCSTEDVLNLPVHPDPPGKAKGNLLVDLLKHQSQALQWCIEREYPVLPKKTTDKPVQFWQLRETNGKKYYYNVATKTPQSIDNAPILGRGALCADSMGLGKTLTMLSLVLATRDDVPTDYSRSTLIVVPLSVLSNWETQMRDHCVLGSLSYYVYYGASRSVSIRELSKHDVVVTTYQVVTKEHADTLLGRPDPAMSQAPPAKKQKKSGSNLFDMQWKRVILDEGHTIRNSRTKAAQGVYALNAQRRWIITGTPIINSPMDLGSILTFLRICQPLDNEEYFRRLVMRPLKQGDPQGADLLKALMSHICIRRTKEMQDSKGRHLVDLPPVEMTLIRVQLEGKARELYDSVEALSRQQFQDYMEERGGMVVPTNILSLLTRLRQLALHPGLVPRNYVDYLRNAKIEDKDQPAITLTPQDRMRLQAVLAQVVEDSEECPICFSILNDPRITACSHAFCLACISEVISRDPKCPMDRRRITMADLIEPAPPTELTQVPVPTDDDDDDDDDDDNDDLRTGSSAKIDQLVHLLRLSPPSEKSLVFSQFTSFLDKIAEVLEKEGISYVRFDGKMSARRRQETLEQFSVPLDDDEAPIPLPETAPTQASSSRSDRSKRSSRAASTIDNGDFADNDDADLDFVMPLKKTTADSDSDFDDGKLLSMTTKRRRKENGKGKAKPSKNKGFKLGNGTLDGSSFEGDNPRVMLISLKAGALGLNLTVANNVYLMDPWWQEGIESQAIDRVNRIGQKKTVRVYQLIADATVESKVIEIQEKKKLLIKEAFSGMKSNETSRQKREARVQDLIQLLGPRNETDSDA